MWAHVNGGNYYCFLKAPQADSPLPRSPVPGLTTGNWPWGLFKGTLKESVEWPLQDGLPMPCIYGVAVPQNTEQFENSNSNFQCLGFLSILYGIMRSVCLRFARLPFSYVCIYPEIVWQTSFIQKLWSVPLSRTPELYNNQSYVWVCPEIVWKIS